MLSENLLWKQVKESLQKKHPGQLIRTVLDKTFLQKTKSKTPTSQFVLVVPSLFYQNLLRSLLPDIQSQMQERGCCALSIQVEKSSPLTQKSSAPLSLSSSYQYPEKRTKPKQPSLFSEYTFSSFVPGPNNNFALATAQSVAQNPVKNTLNPFFLYGSTGLGKTHLLFAIRNFIEQQKSPLTVCYLSTERFFNEYISHIKTNNMSAFRKKYRENINILLLDDCQMLGRGESIQDEFFYTFEALVQSGCQIVLASDRKPGDIKGLKDRIRTRFNGGLVADILPPDQETKIAIIKNHCKALNLSLPQEALHYIAQKKTNDSIRELIGSLKIIKMFCELENKKASFPLIQKLLPFEAPPITPSLKITYLKEKVARFFGINPSELSSKSHKKKTVHARHIAMYLTKELLKLPSSEIGRQFGGKDHSGVLYAVKKIQALSQENPHIKRELNLLRQSLFPKTREPL